MDRAFVVGAELVALDDAGAAMDDQGDGVVAFRRVHRDRICDPHLPAGAHWGATSRDSDDIAKSRPSALLRDISGHCWRSDTNGSSCEADRKGTSLNSRK